MRYTSKILFNFKNLLKKDFKNKKINYYKSLILNLKLKLNIFIDICIVSKSETNKKNFLFFI